jgi:hypothetical protein
MVAETAAANPTNAGSSSGSSETTVDEIDTDFEPVRPAVAQRRQLLALVPPPKRLTALLGGLAAVTAGGAAGFWLSRRSAARRRRPIRRVASRVEATAGLIPLAIRLLANPVVRTVLARIIMRQMRRRIGR